MIVGIGTDLIEIERIKKACEKEAFLVRVYTCLLYTSDAADD